ncbi:unnamed protein product [Urochloa humidicola]
MSALHLQVSTVSQALIFVTRSRSWSFAEPPWCHRFPACSTCCDLPCHVCQLGPCQDWLELGRCRLAV